MNESYVTVCGNVVADPQGRTTKTGKPFASFRVASTTRRWDVESRGFVDGSTNFVNVVGFNALGANVMNSLHRGDPVIVYGRLRVNQYMGADGKNMTSVEIDAHDIGHDLTRGSSVFTRAARPQFEPQDRMADPVILASFDEAGAGPEHDGLEGDPGDGSFEGSVGSELGSGVDAGLDSGVDSVGDAAVADAPDRTEPPRPSGALREEDADTDPYVVTNR